MALEIQNSFIANIEGRSQNDVTQSHDSLLAFKSEIHTLKEELNQEQILHHQEFDVLKRNCEDAINVLQFKLQASGKHSDELNAKNQNTMKQIKTLQTQNEKEKQFMREEFDQKVKLQNEKLNLMKEENTRSRSEVKELKDQFLNKDKEVTKKFGSFLETLELLQEKQQKFFSESIIFNYIWLLISN